MVDDTDFGLCASCFKPMTEIQYAVSLHQHSLSYQELDEETGSQPVMMLEGISNAADCCSNACCKAILPGILEAHGLSSTLINNQVFDSPIHTCGHCGEVILLNNPHAAFVKQKQQIEFQQGEPVLDILWFDVLAVLCANCGNVGAEAIRERERLRIAQ